MKERYWTSIVSSLIHGQCILVLGPEIQAISNNNSSNENSEYIFFPDVLAAHFASECGSTEKGANKACTLSAAAQQFEDNEDSNTMKAIASHFYNSSSYLPSEIHYILASLPFSLILTTCHDDLLTKAMEMSEKNPIVLNYHFRGDKKDNPEFNYNEDINQPIIYHLFGKSQIPSSIVISENDILDFMIAIISGASPLPEKLKQLLKRKDQSFLFIGFGIKQFHLRVLLKVLVRVLELNRTGTAIATEPLKGLSEGEKEQTILFYQRGTRIQIEDSDISPFLKELKCRLNENANITEFKKSVGPRISVFISYASEDINLALRIKNRLIDERIFPWFDKDDLKYGDNWEQDIKKNLKEVDFAFILYTPALTNKKDSFVNKEIYYAIERSREIRGSFIIPILTFDISQNDRIESLIEFQEMQLRQDIFNEDMEKLISFIRREYQRRNR